MTPLILVHGFYPFLCSMLRQVYALLLVAVVISQAFYNAGVVGYWLTNRAYIATFLCENRDKPETHCDGKCYLKKKIAPVPDNPATQSAGKIPELQKGLDLAEFCSGQASVQKAPEAGQPRTPGMAQQSCRGLIIIRDIFHPPAQVCA